MNINIWIPSLFESKGGIQVYSAYFLDAIQSLLPKNQHRVFLKHDINSQIPTVPNSNITYFASGQTPHWLRTPAFTNQLIQASLRQPPNLIISTLLNFTPAAWYLKKLKNIPYWVVVHGIEAWNIQKPLLKIALRDADRILAVSHYTRDRLLQEEKLDPAKVVVLPNTFDRDRFKIANKPQYLLDKYQLTPQQPTILTVARLAADEGYKGYDRIIEALPKIKAAIPDVRYILVGKGDDRSRIEELIVQLELQDCITLAGFVPDEQLCDYYNLCDVFAMPSKMEGFGIVYLEALACGKPTLGGDRDGAIDALCHGELGALVNPDDLEQIAQTLIQILQGTYPNPLMYQPEALRHQAIEYFGFEQFQKTLGSYLAESNSKISVPSHSPSPYSMPKRTFHLWFPNIFEFKGGIQNYGRFLLEAMKNDYPDRDQEIFLMHDKSCDPDFSKLPNFNFYCNGNAPLLIRKYIFAVHLIARAIWQRPDSIFCGHLNFSSAAYLINRLTGIPYWIFIYGLEAWDIKNSLTIKALQNADRVISISSYTRDRLIQEQNLDKNKFSLLPCTLNINNFQIASKPQYLLDAYNLTSQQPIILTVARLAAAERYKGYAVILEALPQIRKSIPDVHYILVGEGSDLARIEQLITRLELQDCVTIAGFVPDEQLSDYYNLCDVFAMPSKKEGFGIVYIEALACGKPVLGGDRDGAIDALCHGELGALVNPDDLEQIAQTLIQILQGTYPNPLMYQPEALRHKVIEYFGFEQFQKTLGSYLAEFNSRVPVRSNRLSSK